MQRTLAYALSPAPVLPLGFLLTAPWFGVLAALLLAGAGDSAFVSRWSAPLLGATHLLTLGYLGMSMAGSMLQLVPVVAGVPLAVSRALALLLWSGLAGGALMLAGAMAGSISALFAPAAAVLACAFSILLLVAGRAVLRPAPPAAQPMLGGMRVALCGLAVTVVLGVLLALGFGGWLSLPLLVLADLHAAWGLVGWVAMLVVCVAFQVVPMFQSSRLYPAAVTRWGPRLLAGLLLGWSGVWLLAGDSARLAGAPLALALAAFAVLTMWMIAGRKRKQTDATTRYWWLALASLGASALLFLLPPGERLTLATGIVFVGGFAMGVVNGMLYKIVPFLLWYHLQHDPRAGKGQVPPIRLILDEAPARRQFWWHCAALAALLAAVYWPQLLARPAALLLACACLLLARDLWRASLRCRRIQAGFQPS